MLQLNELHILSKIEASSLLWMTDKLGYHDAEIFINTCAEISVRLFYGRILKVHKISDIRSWHKKPHLRNAFRGRVFQ